MNVVKEINKINDAELKLGLSGASWHDDYKDSAYVFAGGLNTELTEGDVITIFSQYGEIMDINMPRDKDTGKAKGFAFIMYEDQRSTVLAVDNLNGAKVLERTLRVDHVKNYKQPRTKGEDGEWIEAEEQSLNAKPEMIIDGDPGSESSEDSGPEIDPEDPMRDYLLEKRREAKALKKAKKSKSKGKHKDETPEQRRARKERKKEKRKKKSEKSAGVLGVEKLLESFGGGRGRDIDGGRTLESVMVGIPPNHIAGLPQLTDMINGTGGVVDLQTEIVIETGAPRIAANIPFLSLQFFGNDEDA
ncbi:hypothetical protein C8J55DRAFT_563111 [Lentinula edodes]|uniref:RRM domain-containing protein n=1 Tax=Lentinula lateritia TaxID=40482 RepID=A0A9W9A2B4_9AGAR|nr:hypothetical protein C8J55DRAFT_563111 [Lentinula edodes]